MHFPSWIDSPRNTRAKRASLRLKHMLYVAALHRFGKASVHRIAAEAGCDHSSIFNAIKRGSFTEPMAQSIEIALGREQIRAEWLMAPLDVVEEVSL